MRKISIGSVSDGSGDQFLTHSTIMLNTIDKVLDAWSNPGEEGRCRGPATTT